MDRPETRYARSGDVNIAYQVVGDGPFDLVLVPDAEHSARAALFGYSEGASMAALFATTYPDRTAALIMYGSYLAWDWMAEGRFASRRESTAAALEEIERRWGMPDYCDELLENDAPSMLGDERFRRWYATRLRLSASPAAAADLQRMNIDTDTRMLLPSIRVPTLIVHWTSSNRRRRRWRSATGRGGSCSTGTTRSFATSWPGSAASRWTARATACSRPSTGLRAPSAARARSSRRCATWTWR